MKETLLGGCVDWEAAGYGNRAARAWKADLTGREPPPMLTGALVALAEGAAQLTWSSAVRREP